jgi:hypothetical protein
LQSDILATKRELQKVEAEIAVVKTTYPFDMKKYLELKSKVQSLKDGIKELEDIRKEFGFVKSESSKDKK